MLTSSRHLLDFSVLCGNFKEEAKTGTQQKWGVPSIIGNSEKYKIGIKLEDVIMSKNKRINANDPKTPPTNLPQQLSKINCSFTTLVNVKVNYNEQIAHELLNNILPSVEKNFAKECLQDQMDIMAKILDTPHNFEKFTCDTRPTEEQNEMFYSVSEFSVGISANKAGKDILVWYKTTIRMQVHENLHNTKKMAIKH